MLRILERGQVGGGGLTFSWLETNRRAVHKFLNPANPEFWALRNHFLHLGHIQSAFNQRLVTSVSWFMSVKNVPHRN